MAFARIALADGSELCVANLHLSAGQARSGHAEEELRLAAERAVEWSDGAPLILGGDVNLRPADTASFDELEDLLGLTGTTGPNALDHLLARGLTAIGPPEPWPPEGREVRAGGRAIRLSDHAPVAARFRTDRAGTAR
jgi:endonuclease/exonuclease/phosphatase family metal-dependent hydrolase